MGCVALTVWEDRISPVFDGAHDLMIAAIDNGRILDRRYVAFDPDRIASLVTILQKQNVECLICGAISESPARVIMESGIRLVSFISGDLDRVLDLIARGESIVPGFLMPGCRCPRRGTYGRHRLRANRNTLDGMGHPVFTGYRRETADNEKGG